MAQVKLLWVGHGKETVAGTNVNATFKHRGPATLDFGTTVVLPELGYASGVLGGNVEGQHVVEECPTLTLADAEFSAEGMVWLGNMAIKEALGAASSFAFTFPTTAINTIHSFSWEIATTAQDYEFSYGFVEEFNLHANANTDSGQIFYNAKVRGRKVTTTTATASLGFLASLEPLNIKNATVHFDALGTAAGTAAATAGYLKGFNLDFKTGWIPGFYADGRSTLDLSQPDFTEYKITGEIECLLGATAITEIANARAATGRVMSIKCNGSSSRLVKIDLPLIYSGSPEYGAAVGDQIVCKFPFQAGYSRTTTAQGPAITVTTAASTTVT